MEEITNDVTYPLTVSENLLPRVAWFSDATRRNGIHLLGGPGSGKSRALGRLLAWFRLPAR